MASMIYGVSRNGRKGIKYVKPKGKETQPKRVEDIVIKHTPLYSHFTYEHTHDIKHTSNAFSAKPKFKQNFGNSNKQGPKKIWVPKDKIIYVAYVFNNKVETPILVHGLWMLSTHNRKKSYLPKSRT